MCFAQHPAAVEQNLIKAGGNRPELEKVIAYCKQTKDPEKLQAIYFLISHMDIHTTIDYYWQNTEGKKIEYNELDYPDFEQAAQAFETLKTQNSGLKPHAFTSKDLEVIKADFLIDNIEKAFISWKNTPLENVSFQDFCEYILPYRISVEPLQKWRTLYASKFDWLHDKIKANGLEAILPYVKDHANTWFTNTWGRGGRNEPLPLLGSQQLIMRKQGTCADMTNLGVFGLRSVGIPATVNSIPFWATATGAHSTNTFFDSNAKPIAFDFGVKIFNQKLLREPAKVLRTTYSKQATALINFEDPEQIPPGHLQAANYIDVTQSYWQTTTVSSALYPNVTKPKIVYVATFNGLKWQPFWWGLTNNNQSQWEQICVGTVIIPHYYINKKMVPAAPPIVVNEKENRVLKPDFSQLITVSITSFASYLLIKPNVTYKLFYWDDQWKLVQAIKTDTTTETLIYNKVPKNALLLLVASNSKGLERPFIIDANGQRQWF